MGKHCGHIYVDCINQYELIRKYICKSCGEVMMCECNKEFGQKFLPHQLNEGSWLETKKREPVTLGFQKKICPECRGEKPVPAPKAPLPGATSKIKRFYWREIYFETTRRFSQAFPNKNNPYSYPEICKPIEHAVVEEIKELHQKRPKYEYKERSQSEVIEQTNTDIILVRAKHITGKERKVGIKDGNEIVDVEQFAANYFIQRGYQVLKTESVPFHVLFGVFMWVVIQDPDDPKYSIIQFGDRFDSENKKDPIGFVTTILPEDFGSPGYYRRQIDLIKVRLDQLDDIDWMFEYSLESSFGLRQYLWAHREKDINTARKIINIIKLTDLKKILNYMSMDYWRNFCGWPDLLVHGGEHYFFVEVKSSNDRLSEDQKRWLLGNCKYMHFEVKIFKVGKL